MTVKMGCTKIILFFEMPDESDSFILKSLVKLEDNSMLGGENVSPFWRELSSEISKDLWLPTDRAVGVDSLNNCLSDYAKKMGDSSWFSAKVNSAVNQNSYSILCPSKITSIAGWIGNETTKKKSGKKYGKNPYKKSKKVKPNKVLKIPVWPSNKLHQIWKQLLAAYRRVYNECVAFFNAKKSLPDKKSLDQVIQAWQELPENQWTKCLGKTRQEAVCEAEQAYKQARVANQGQSFKLRFRSCRDKHQAIQFKNDAYRNGTWFPTKINNQLYCTAIGYEIPQNCDYGTELLYQRGQWFACFPIYIPPSGTSSDKVIAIDPGVRTFLTGYDGENILEIGKKDIGKIVKLCLHLDGLIGKKMTAKGKANKRLRYRLNKVIDRQRFRIRCLVDDLHHKASSLLVNSYKLIFLPSFEVSKMVLKSQRKINRKSVRKMLAWATSRWASHLKQAAKRKNVLVIRTNEAYTSKTCPNCGEIHHHLGGAEYFKCPSCGFNSPRDWVGAFNNMLKALQATAFRVEGNSIVISDADVITAQSC